MTSVIFCSKVIQLSFQALQHSWHIILNQYFKNYTSCRILYIKRAVEGVEYLDKAACLNFYTKYGQNPCNLYKLGKRRQQQLKSLLFWLLYERKKKLNQPYYLTDVPKITKYQNFNYAT